MKTSYVSIVLTLLLVAGIGMSAALLVYGPDRVERQTIALFETQQSLIAEQGAMRISETFRDIQTRTDEAAERIERYGPRTDDRRKLRRRLSELSHPSDTGIGLTFMVVSAEGEVLAVGPNRGRSTERPRDWAASFPEDRDGRAVNLCADCLDDPGSISIVSRLKDGRRLVSHIRLDKLLDGVFQRITRGRHAHAALLDSRGDVLFDEQTDGVGATGELLSGKAKLLHNGWRVLVETPRSAIAPEVRESVQSMLYASAGILVVLLLALGFFGYFQHRAHAAKLARVQGLARTDKLATVGMLGSSVAHEINNVISAAKLNLEIARQQRDGGEHEALDAVTDSIERLEELAESITDYVGEESDETDVFGLREAVEETVALVSPKIDEEWLEVDVSDNPTIEGSKTAISQVLVNLLLNAYDAIDQAPEDAIELRLRESGGAALVEVLDDGPGIEPAIRERVFEPFTSTKGDAEEGGTGLGLWLCAEIVEQHDGNIFAENRQDGGARFAVRLPIADDAAQRLPDGSLESRTPN